MGLWSRTYVCCAVPLYNSGIYAILAQFAIISLVTGILSFAAPSIVAVSIPSFGSYILGAVCILVAAFQIVGFLGVYREKPGLFKTYARVNMVLVLIALAIALAWVILSAARHSTAVTTCQNLFADPTNPDIQSGTDVCNVWTWIQIGIMGLLFVIVGLCEAYFLMFTQIYSSEQKLDHARYNSVYSTAANEIRESGLWEASRNSTDEYAAPGYPRQHGRQGSGLRNEVGRGEYYESEDDLAREKEMGASARVRATEDAFEPPRLDHQAGYRDDYGGQQHAYEYEQAGYGQGHAQQPYGYASNYAQQPYAPHQQQQQQGWDSAYHR